MLEDKGYSKLGESLDYKYLTRMFMDSVTQENVEKIKKELEEKQSQLDITIKTSVEDLWSRELEELSQHLEDSQNSIKEKDKSVKPEKKKKMKLIN